VDLNADLGEGVGDDDAVLDVVSSASVACGVHAGDADTMRRTLEAAAARGVVVGAHPSFPDRAGFGRRDMELPAERVTEEVLTQLAALEAVAHEVGTSVRYVKPHGALYNRMARDEECAVAVIEALRRAGRLVLLAPAGSVAVALAGGAGVDVASEAFADRSYRADGAFVSRGDPGAVLTDHEVVAGRALAICFEHAVTAHDGTRIALEASSICVHGDTPGAARLARRVREVLVEAGVAIRPFVS
jgi:UPF0271 protein